MRLLRLRCKIGSLLGPTLLIKPVKLKNLFKGSKRKATEGSTTPKKVKGGKLSFVVVYFHCRCHMVFAVYGRCLFEIRRLLNSCPSTSIILLEDVTAYSAGSCLFLPCLSAIYELLLPGLLSLCALFQNRCLQLQCLINISFQAAARAPTPGAPIKNIKSAARSLLFEVDRFFLCYLY